MQITVLGAGYMGSAMAKIAAARGHSVRLWGTWLDNALLDAVESDERSGQHPRLKLPMPELALYRAPQLQQALADAELVIHAVNSDGAVPVMTRAAPFLPDVPILSVTKGFLESRSGRMDRIDVVVSETVGRPLRFVHAAGPAKAMEIARNVLTWMHFAGADAELCAQALRGDQLQIGITDDLAGAEICSTLKNAYATGIGLWDGLMATTSAPSGCDVHNARAACFTQAIAEMRSLVVAGGGRTETVHGVAGIGDLHVTAVGGRNRVFGERVGRGRPASEVASQMLAEGELTEGYPVIATAVRFARECNVRDLPLLHAIHAIVWENAPVASTLGSLRFSVKT